MEYVGGNMRVAEIFRALPVLEKIGTDEYLSFGFSLKISDLLDEITKIREAYYKRINTLQQKYGEKDEDGQLKYDTQNEGTLEQVSYVVFSEDNKSKYISESQKLLEEEVEIKSSLLTIEELDKCGVGFSPVEISQLKPFIKREE